MRSVGNDVVDLKEPENLGKSRNSRFLKKILTDAEIESVKNAHDPDRALWSLWACKETAYKVMQKSFPDIAFIPRRWQVMLHASRAGYSEGEVIIPGKSRVFTRVFFNDEYVYCIGTGHPASLDRLIWSVERLPQVERINPSLFLRHVLGHNLAQYYSLDFHQIKIRRTREKGRLRPPRVYVGGRARDIDISLSHDGRFVAYAFSETR